ncbi:MAG: ComEC/Rec2 family competence protein [Candidatus Portnoybacteria bacterium]
MFKSFKITFSVLVVLFGGTVITWSIVFSLTSNGILEVIFFDVGQGDAIFVETPSKKQVLIDGGPDKSVLEKLNQEMPFYDRNIDLVILTHPDADHLTGLIEVLEYYQVGHILASGFENDTATYKLWQELIEEKDIDLTLAQTGQKIFLEDNIVLEILWPDQSKMETISESNNASVVGRLVYRQSEILLTGDIERKIENILLSQDLESDILKVAHHGSKTSTSYNFFQAVNPQIAIISVGEDNRYKHPNEEVLKQLENISVYRTDENGDIKVFTDGNLFNIITEYE